MGKKVFNKEEGWIMNNLNLNATKNNTWVTEASWNKKHNRKAAEKVLNEKSTNWTYWLSLYSMR